MAALSQWIWTCLVVVFVMKTTHVQGQSVVISASDVFVLGDEKSLYCAVTTTSRVTIEWFVGGRVVSGTDLPTQVVSGWYVQKSRYTFRVAASDDGKKYVCRANTGSSVISDTWTVYVYRHPDDPVISGPTSVLGGTNVTWVCTVDGAVGSGPTVSWRFGNGTSIGSSLYSGKQGFYTSSNGLLVRNVTSTLTLPITNGAPPFVLVCKSTQSSTSNTKTASVSVSISYSPVVTVPGTIYTVTQGSDVTLLCEASSSPSPSAILWYHNDAAVNTSLDRYLGATATTPSLTIRTANRQDAGSYLCGATNSIGSSNASTSINLVVHYAPVITYSQNPVSGEANADVVLSCSIDAVPPFTTIYWYRITGSNPETSTTINPAANPSKYSGGTASTPALTIKSLATADQGLYRCVADNNVGRGRGALLTVSVVYRPQITVGGSLTTTESQSVSLTCTVDAVPEATSVTWYKGGQVLNTSDSSRYSGGNVSTPSLTILSVGASDAGVYYCSAANSVGSTSSDTFNLTVRYSPIITVPQTQLAITQGSSITLSVSVSAFPALESLEWRRQTGATSDSQVTVDVASSSKYGGGSLESPSLQIINATISEAGIYVVVANNSLGSRQASLTLVVSYAPTTVTVTGNNVTGVDEGSAIILTCSADGNPSPNYEWTRDRGNQVLSTSRNLTIPTATPAHAGQYTCKAYNNEGSATASVNVSVLYSPRAADTLRNVTASVGDTVTLTCAVIANPAPYSYRWTKDGVTVKSSSSSSQLQVTISDQDDLGRYQCRATSRRGTSGPISVFVLRDDDNVGQSTDDTGLSTTTLILIIIVCIILLIVIILIIIYCCLSGKCGRKKKDNTVSPSVVAPPPIVPAGEKPISNKPPTAVAATATPNGHVSRSTAPLSARSGNGHLDTPRDKTDPATARNGTASLGHGMSISLPGGHTPRPHHLPPLGQDGVPEETESADDDKHRKKKRRRRHNADGTPQNNLQV